MSDNTFLTTGERKQALRNIYRYIGYLFFIALLCQGMYWDALPRSLNEQFSESSFAEISQSIMLVLSLWLLWRVRQLGVYRHGVVLMFAFLLASLIREQDALLDGVFDDLWQWLVALTLIPGVIYLVRFRLSILDECYRYMQQMSFGLFLSGFLTLYVFSRMIGRGIFWHAVLGSQYLYEIKAATEEGIETLGYALILLGIFEMWLWARRQMRGVS